MKYKVGQKCVYRKVVDRFFLNQYAGQVTEIVTLYDDDNTYAIDFNDGCGSWLSTEENLTPVEESGISQTIMEDY